MSHKFQSVEVKKYVRGDGIGYRIAVRAATTGPILLGNNLVGASVDGVILADGDRVLVKNQPEVQQVVTVTTTADIAGSLGGTYFLLSAPSGDFYVWNNVGASIDPALPGRTGIMAAFAPGSSANATATAVAAAVDADANFAAIAVANVVTITVTIAGLATAASAGTSTFGILTAQGSSARDHGIWTVAVGAGASYRADDLIVGDNAAFVSCNCELGTQNAKTTWTQVTNPAVVGTNALSWVQSGLFNYSANQLFYGTSASTMGTLPSIADRTLVADNSGVLTFSTTLPTGTLINGPFTTGTQVVNKDYVDTTAIWLNPKESVRLRTLADIGGVYLPAGGTGGTGAFTGVNLTSGVSWDLGPALIVGDRVLVMSQTDKKQNGIYVVTVAGAAGALERAADLDGTPPEEVSGGVFVFVEAGPQFARTGWVLQGVGTLTINVDNLIWVQYSAATGAAVVCTQITATLSVSTTSNTYVLMSGMTFTPPAGNYLVLFSTTGSASTAAAEMFISIYVGGVAIAHSERRYRTPTSTFIAMQTQAKINANGIQAVEIRFRRSAGTFTVDQRSMQIITVA